MLWPAKRFRIVRAAANDYWIGLFSSGPALEPDLTVSAAEMPDDEAQGETLENESVLLGTPMENLQCLGYSPNEEPRSPGEL